MGEFLALGSAVAWAFTSIAMRQVALGPLWRASVVRMLVGGALLLLYAWPTGGIDRALASPPAAWAWLLGSTISSMVVGDSLYFMAGARIGVSRALPIASSFPLLSTAGAVLFLGEEPTYALLAGSVLVVAAVTVISAELAPGGGRLDLLGVGLALMAAMTWATSGLLLGPALGYLDPVAANTIRFPIGALLFAAYVGVVRPRERFTPRLLVLACLGGVGTVFSALLFLGGIAEAGVARGVALNATSPVFTAVLAAWLLRERVTRQTYLGIALSVAGSALLVL